MSSAAQLRAGCNDPIGVFDSGVGGLTVLRALLERFPHESFVYLGDTARVPYGTKSAQSVTRYSLQASACLVERGVKCLVVACNTASAVALEALRQRYAPLPVLGVVEPGARAGCEASVSGRIAVIGTESTIRGGAYQRAISSLRPDAEVIATACPLFVGLAEEGWTQGPIVEAIAHRYLDPVFGTSRSAPDTLVLGCTHFPVLADALQSVLGDGIRVVDSAHTTAVALERLLAEAGLTALRRSIPASADGRLHLLSTDEQERFRRVGSVFLGAPIAAEEVEVVDLGPGFPDRVDRVP
jgi:glutamate racemase